MADQEPIQDEPPLPESYEPCECLEDALDIAERLLMDAPMFSDTHRIVPDAELLRLVQRLNAAANDPGGHPKQDIGGQPPPPA
jgi:hypothetical protein